MSSLQWHQTQAKLPVRMFRSKTLSLGMAKLWRIGKVRTRPGRWHLEPTLSLWIIVKNSGCLQAKRRGPALRTDNEKERKEERPWMMRHLIGYMYSWLLGCSGAIEIVDKGIRSHCDCESAASLLGFHDIRNYIAKIVATHWSTTTTGSLVNRGRAWHWFDQSIL